MSVRLMAMVWDIPLADSEKIVLLALADNANDEGYCWPSVTTLARKCSKSERTIQAAMKSLEASGHIGRAERSGTSTVYTVHPRSGCTPAEISPPQRPHPTPATVAPHPRSGCTQTIKNHQEPSPLTPHGGRSPVLDLRIAQVVFAALIAGCEHLAASTLTPDHVLEAWNDLAGRYGLAKAKMNDRRRKAALARIRQHPVEDFTEAIACLSRNPWMHGDNERGWRADFDFFLQPKSFTRLVEGSYDRTQSH